MCIIAIKPQDKPMFSETLIRTMFTNNPDGAGYMYPHHHGVRIRKGFMTIDTLLTSLATVPDGVPLVLHCRIGTHGGNTPQNTHPFPITFNLPDLQSRRIDTPLGMAHNGIINGMYPRATISDTMEYILTVVAPLMALSPHAYRTTHGKQLLDTTSGSKLAFLDIKGNIETVGDFITDDGYMYSNSSYKSRVYTSRDYSGFYNAYDTDDEYTPPEVWGCKRVSPVPEGAYIHHDGELVELDDGTYISDDGSLYTEDDLSGDIVYISSDMVYAPSGAIVRFDYSNSENRFFHMEDTTCIHS